MARLSKRPWARWATLIALAIVVAAVARLPARQAAALITSPGLQLDGLSGTVWAGQAAAVRYGELLLGQARWELDALPLLWLTSRATVQLEGPELSAHGQAIQRPGGEIRLRDATARLPAEWLQRILNEPFLGLGGRINLQLDHVVLDEQGWLRELTGTGRWLQARITGRLQAELGELTGRFETDSEGIIRGRLEDRGGPLQLQGHITVHEETYRVDLELGARGDAIALRQALQVLGNPGRDGRVRITISGPMLALGHAR